MKRALEAQSWSYLTRRVMVAGALEDAVGVCKETM